jgi:hypothetical protein
MERILADVDAHRSNDRIYPLGHGVLLCLVTPSKHHSLEGREHGRTIPLSWAARCLTFRATRLSADDRKITTIFTIGSIFGATDQPATRNALLTENWRGCEGGRAAAQITSLAQYYRSLPRRWVDSGRDYFSNK